MLLSGCGNDGEIKLPDGAKTIEGMYISTELPVAYYFSADGFGQQYIGNEVYQIRYYILGDRIYIENFSVEGGSKTDFSVALADGYILIGGIEYKLEK